ncbi:carbon-nitrogen hydrolase family protein [Alsobacter sp. SYSU M60028]|uniref:Carbon-nitrogen hydrolase family protein n=1 Tax=Alsobacter ponti TaxID=2962936 RepID=A0ABT1LBQ4_9HYPH|nr:carbon-nitrogen hydrolase family protein [Alsobacter ponti]MCP8938920.1 carbon-nitrogen hydrolase family protein [Alsobacter ponti]
MSSHSVFRAACVQMRSGMTPAANIDQAAALVREAAGLGASYVQTPEMSNAVCRDRDTLFASLALEEADPMLAAFRELARELRIHLHAGSLAILRPDGKVANRAFLIDPRGDVTARYDKIHLYDVDLPNGESWRESRTYTGGDRAVVADLPQMKLGMTICYDIRFPHLYRALAEAGAQMLSAPACFTKQTGEAHWVVLHRARAIETGSFMVSAAQAGHHEDGRDTFGHSIIVDPWGRVLAEAGAEPGVIAADIDPALVADARARIPTLAHARAFTLEPAGELAEPPRGSPAWTA